MRSCIFCDSIGPLSNEDAWPLWLNETLGPMVPDGAKANVLIETSRGFSKQIHDVPGIHPAKTRKVCEQCNTGWMSQLESEVKPVLTPLILGQTCQLSAADQELIATWAIKTAITMQHTVPGEEGFPPKAAHTWLRTKRTPPPRYRVFLGAVTPIEDKQPLRWEQSKALVVGAPNAAAAASPKLVNTFVTMLLAGHVVFQVIGDFRVDRKGGVPAIAPRLFDRVWPVRAPLVWPGIRFSRPQMMMLSQSEARQTNAALTIEWYPPIMLGRHAATE